MKLPEHYLRIIGFVLLTIVIILLVSTPSMLIAKSVTTIDTELSHASGSETPVRTLLDFGNSEHMRAFSYEIGDWESSVLAEYNTTNISERLGAEVLLMRAYSHPKLYQPVFLLIMQSSNRSSFHPPPVCYPALGYTIEGESTEEIIVPNTSWAEGPWLSEGDVSFKGTIAVKELIVARKSKEDGRLTERRVVLYFYVKDNPFTSDAVTMIRVEALAPLEGSYDGIRNITKEFMGETIPYLFELQRKEPPLFMILLSGSILSKLALVLLVLAPLTLILYPQIRRITDKENKGLESSIQGLKKGFSIISCVMLEPRK
ncbi:MAG: exosortase-associated EpsI family protein [Methanophagales archaeon ANME-1-THS]|nr:MAG: exosortase-associated EpsI family protein [Methanophagales archaeon ANME-1-THS]